MLSFLIGAIGAVIGLIGWFSSNSVVCLVLGTIAYAIETILEEDNLNASAKTDIFKAFGVGSLVSLIKKNNPWYIGGLLVINIWSALLSILGFAAIAGKASRK